MDPNSPWNTPDDWRADGTRFSDLSSLRTTPWTALLSAKETRPGQNLDIIIKRFAIPRDVVQDPERIAAEREKFLAAAKIQKDLSDIHAKGWVQVFHLSHDPDNTAFAMRKCGPSLKDYIDNRLALSAKDLYGLVLSVLEGLNELFIRNHRSHGNLKASDILVACPGDPLPYKLSDPAPKGEEHSANDLYALGAVLYHLIEQREYDPLTPIIATTRWDRFGAKRDRWMHFINALLNPNGWHDPLPRVIKEAQRLKPASPVRNAALAGAGALVLLAAAFAAYKFLPPLLSKMNPPGPATLASNNLPAGVDPQTKAALEAARTRYAAIRTKWQNLVNNSKFDHTKARAQAREAFNLLPDPTAPLTSPAAVHAAVDSYGKAADKLTAALATATDEEAAGQTAEKSALDAFTQAKTEYTTAKANWDSVSAKLTPRFPHPRSKALAESIVVPDPEPPSDIPAIRNAAVAFHAAAEKLVEAATVAMQEEGAAQNIDKLHTAFDQARAKYQDAYDRWQIASKAADINLKAPNDLVDQARAALPNQIVLSDSDPNTYKTATAAYTTATAKIQQAITLLNDSKAAATKHTADTSDAVARANEALSNHNYAEALTWYKKAATLGYAPAMWQVGLLYETGDAGEQDLAQAARWYKQAADLNEPRAMTDLGGLYEKGRGVDKDLAQAAALYRKAADLKYPPAMVNLGVFCENGIAVEKNLAQARTWYEQAADLNNSTAMFYLGVLYEKGKGVTVDYDKAMAWYKKAADLHNAAAMNAIGNLYDNSSYKTDPAQALAWYKKAADAGYAPAMCNLGAFYDNGKGTPLDHDQAFKWFKKAADLNNGMAMFNLGILYETGRGVDKNITQALAWYRKAAHSDDPAAVASATDRLGKLGFPVGD
jgi:TPR repeat protein